MEYPRRFYEKKSRDGEKKLKFPSEIIHRCRWCGTFFVDYLTTKLCSGHCRKLYSFWNDT